MSLHLPVGEDISLAFGVPSVVQQMPVARQIKPGLAQLNLATRRLYSCTQGRPSCFQPLIVARWPCWSRGPSKPVSTL